MKSNDGSAGETCADNIEIGQLSVLSTEAGMNSTSDSFFENASASDDSVWHSKSEGRRVPEGHDDCLSRVSGADEHANKKSDTEDSRVKYNKPSKISGGSSDRMPSSSSQTGLNSQNLGFSKSSDVATGSPTVQNTFSQASNGKFSSHEKIAKDVKDGKPSATKDELLEVSTEHQDSLSPRVASVASDVCGDPPATALNFIQKNEDTEVVIQPSDESDDSDMVEQDVKVCDICGDAGREDLLAICSRCSDGAEHTYCMREMQAKVPEGEWLCEECQAMERLGNGRLEKSGKMDENEKNNSGHTSSEYVNNSDVEGQRTKGSMRIPSKRHRDDDDAEVSSMVKKHAVDSNLGSPRPSNSGKTAALTRENSLKNLDKGRLQSSDTVPVNDNTESSSSASDLRVHGFRGTFSKSNSFSSMNSKPKVKLVDQVVIQRQKSAKEPSSFRHKEGGVRSIGKSVSFKSLNSSRSETKTVMLSPRLSHIKDIKNTKQRSPFERQHSFKTERSSINSVMGTSVNSTSTIDKRPALRGESSSLTNIANHHEMKPVQADGRSASLSRSSSLAARRTADFSSSSGDFKRPSMHGHSTLGVSSANGVNINEQKCNQTNSKEDFSCPAVAERPPVNVNEGIPDGLPGQKDLINSAERMKECSVSRSGPQSVKSSRDESDNLKAAIEAAVLRKPGVYRKHRPSSQSDDSSVPSSVCDVASHQDPISSPAGKKKLPSEAELPERTLSRNFTVDSLKQETSNFVKQSSVVPVEGLFSGGRDGGPISSSTRDVLRNVPAAMPFFLKSVAVPDHDYIWQGSFEICRSGNSFDSWDGIQAHLSTCASPKVIDAVNKFKRKIVLYEVPRLSTWPVQFQEHGVREDNIAVFFFAKDLESYDKMYKVMLSNMMKNDLALKGNVNGVELLIFPSNQLPENSQRWNMLFFLWGVFRGKKESCLQQMPESLKQFCASRDIPPPIMSFPENRCSLRPMAEDLHGSEDAAPLLEMPASEELHRLLSSRAANRDCGSKDDPLSHRLNSSSSSAVQNDRANQWQEMTSQEGDMSSSCSLPLAAMGSSSCPQMLMQPGKQQSSNHSRLLEEHIERVKSRPDVGDLNMEHNRWTFNHNECMVPGSSQTLYADASGQVPLRNDDTCGPLAQTNHPLNRPLTLETDESAERRFFPTESQPGGIHLAVGSMPWKMHHLSEQDRAPDLELALGAAERKSRSLLGNSKVTEEHNIIEEAVGTTTKAEDDVAASLSLSLSFPFPDKELSTPKPERERVKTSMLLFGNLRDN